MHREDNSKYLLYIEPKASEKLKEPINDELTELMEMALSKSEKGTGRYSDINDMGTFRGGSGYKGLHGTECGQISTNGDYLLENGMITNSLVPFYLRWYRYSIPETEMKKVLELQKFYK
jgi:hypothetical protein